MISSVSAPDAESHGVISKANFSFSQSVEDQAHMAMIVRDGLYKNKPLAVLREYSTNAWDAHVDAGKGDTPFDVTLPTPLKPELVVRDYGDGLDEAGVYEVFGQYGRSTKRNSNTQVGQFGIGSGAAFAYADTYTIVSRHNGTRSVYVAALDGPMGSLSKLSEEECDINDTGISIHVPVKSRDAYIFTEEAQKLYRFFKPQPVINGNVTLQNPNTNETKHGAISGRTGYGNGKWLAIMGNVPYPVDFDQPVLMSAIVDAGAEDMCRFSGYMYFDIGELDIPAPREEVSYTEKTCKAIAAKMQEMFEDFKSENKKKIDKLPTEWDRRVATVTFLRDYGIRLSNLADPHVEAYEVTSWSEDKVDNQGNKVKDFAGNVVQVTKYKHEAKNFRLHRINKGYRGGVTKDKNQQISVNHNTRLILRDDRRGLRGFRDDLTENDYLIEPLERVDKNNIDSLLSAAEKEVKKLAKKHGYEGLKIIKMSDLDYYGPARATRDSTAERSKYSQKMFKWKGTDLSTDSDNWEPVDREPKDGDIYVVLYRFKPTNHLSLYSVKHFMALYKRFTGKAPTLYGYRDTNKNPVDESKLKGISFNKWREHAEVRIKNHKRVRDVAIAYAGYRMGDRSQKERQLIASLLGPDHEITKMASTEGVYSYPHNSDVRKDYNALPDSWFRFIEEEWKESLNKYAIIEDIGLSRVLQSIKSYAPYILAVDNGTIKF